MALIVMMSHFYTFLDYYASSSNVNVRLLAKIIPLLFCGPAAVITFFVLSGFVIHFPHREKNKIDVLPFLVKRLVRIGLPLLFIGLVASYFGMFEKIPIWSLYCELIYYVIYPVLFRIKTSWRNKFLVSFISSYAILLVFKFNLFLSFFQHSENHYQGEYWELGVVGTAVLGLPCWLLGVLLASRINQINYPVTFKRLVFFRFLLYLLSCCLLVGRFHFYLSYMLSLNLFALFGVKWIEYEIVYYRKHRCNKYFEFGGKFSYSLYLCHQIIIAGIGLWLILSPLTLPLYILLTILGAFFIYRLIEYPSHILAQKLSDYAKNFI